MPREVMRRQAKDNEYLHKDFHGALSVALEYLRTHYGEDAVREYLRRFARSYFAPLHRDLCRRGLVALKEHLEELYRVEKAEARIEMEDDELLVEVDVCPAVAHMREQGYPASPLFVETTSTVYAALCEDTPFAFELLEYDPGTGRSRQRFLRRPS